MEAGQITTGFNGRDTTEETITQFRIWLWEIDAALFHHREQSS